MRRIIPILAIIIIGGLPAAAQVSGKVTDEAGEGIPGINVVIKSSGEGMATDGAGSFSIKASPGDSILFTGVGFKARSILVQADRTDKIIIRLEEDTEQLEEVMVVGKSEFAEKRELPYSISVIDTRPLKAQNLDINQVLNTTSGIRIREEGGLGSRFNFSLNGFTGNQVKFFIDGIPMDNFGSSLTLNNIPVNLISGIEVYKGVVPVYLGSDALGGAINVTTDKSVDKFLNVSYSVGSFNTHRASIVSKYTTGSGLIVNTNAFFNYSDNNYSVEVQIPDPESGKLGDPEEIERFHDRYQSQSVQLELGVKDKPFADRLFLGVTASGNYKEIQNGSNMTRVVGEAYNTDKVLIPTLKYQKDDLLTSGLSIRLNAMYTMREAMVVDTASKIYDWHGNFVYRGIDVTSGEINWDKTQFRFDDQSVLATANLSYEITPYSAVAFNNTFSRYERVGEDPISYNAVPFSQPNILTKSVSGLAYSISLLEDQLKSTVFTKMFILDALTREGADVGDNVTLDAIYANETQFGFGMATTYFIAKGIQIKGSYENTYRLPEAYEMFGDGLLLESNPHLTSEKSKNFNAGFLIQKVVSRHEFLVEANYLYRLPEDLIRNNAVGITSQYENLQSAKSHIYEGGIRYQFDDLLNLSVNGTYQDIVNNQKYTQTGGENYLYGDRIPNTPFLFGNFTAGLLLDGVAAERSNMSLNWTTQFVEAFYLKWPSQGSRASKYDIPRQLSHNISISYSWMEGRYNMSLVCTNLMDSKLFDNFMLQKPGRAFNLKLSYFLQ